MDGCVGFRGSGVVGTGGANGWVRGVQGFKGCRHWRSQWMGAWGCRVVGTGGWLEGPDGRVCRVLRFYAFRHWRSRLTGACMCGQVCRGGWCRRVVVTILWGEWTCSWSCTLVFSIMTSSWGSCSFTVINKRPLTPKSMPPTNDKRLRLKGPGPPTASS